ncbi:hypothetical protein PQR02_40125, partial [Paraburkholderia sediminicola]
MANGDAVIGDHNLLDEQSRDALTVLNVEGRSIAAQTPQESRERFRQPQGGFGSAELRPTLDAPWSAV